MTDKFPTGNSSIVRVELHPEILMLLAPLDTLPANSDFEEEREYVARSVPKRRREFFAGRNLARIALQLLGEAECSIPGNEDRTPLWPGGFKGSISHSDEFVTVALTSSRQLNGVGIDIEPVNGVDPELRPIISTDAGEDPLDETVLFSAKEAVFKAVYPICGEFLEFGDVSISRSGSGGEFIARVRQGLASRAFIDRGTGISTVTGNLVTTAYWIRR